MSKKAGKGDAFPADALAGGALPDDGDRLDIDALCQNNGVAYRPRVYVFRCRQCGRLRANRDGNPAFTREPRHL